MFVKPAIAEDVFCFSQSIDYCEELGALAGRSIFLDLKALVVNGVDAAEDATARDRVWTAVVATCSVGGDDDGVSMGSGLTTAVADVGTRARSHLDFVVLARALADPAGVAAAQNEL